MQRVAMDYLMEVLSKLQGGLFIIRTEDQNFRGQIKMIRLEPAEHGKVLHIEGVEVLIGKTTASSRKVDLVRDFAFAFSLETTNCTVTEDQELGYEVFIYPIPDASGTGDHGNVHLYSAIHRETRTYKEHIRS